MNTSRKFKIGIANSYYYPDVVGGAEVVVKILAETYRKLGHEVFVITSGKEDRVDDVNGIKVYRVKNRNLYWGKESKKHNSIEKIFWHWININNPLVKRKVGEIVEKEKPDIIHTHNLNELTFGVLETFSRSGAKLIHTLHDYSFMCLNTMMFKDMKNCEKICPGCLLYASLKKKFTGYVDYLVGVSRFIVERHRKHGFFTNREFSVIYNPVTFRIPDTIERNHKDLIFGFIGRLHPSKGIEILLKTFDTIKKPLLVAGNPYTESYGTYLKSISKSGNIKFLGWVQAEEFYKLVDVIILPSLWHDPSPTVIHEANAYGVPVLASNRGGLPELVHKGVNGFIFNPLEPDSLAELVNSLDRNTIDELSMKSIELSKKFLPEKVALQYIETMLTKL